MYRTNNQQTVNFLSKKTERISVALYMVTSLLSDHEPLKWELRTQSLELRSRLHMVQHNGGSFAPNVFEEKKGVAKELLSLIEIARLARVVSEMNANILSREISALVALFEDVASAKEAIRDVSLDDTFFAVADRPLLEEKKDASPLAPKVRENSSRAYHENDASGVLYQADAQVENEAKETKKDEDVIRHTNTDVRGDLSKENRLPRAMNGGARDARKNAIIKILKKRPGVTIKDITDAVPGYSEKTIQRELIVLIKDNLVERRGERRWSRYWLVQ